MSVRPAPAPQQAPPRDHELADAYLVDEPVDERVCHLLNGLTGSYCGRAGLGLTPHAVRGDPLASPCAGGCGRRRCGECAAAYAGV